VSAFASALAALVADVNLGVTATWQRGNGTPAQLRVIRSAPDEVSSAFDSSVITATDILTVPVAACPDVLPGDTFTIGSTTLVAQSALLDATGTAWRVACRR